MKSITTISLLAGLASAGPTGLVHSRAAAVVPQQQAGQGPFTFTSTYNLIATPDKVINAENATAPGETGAIGYYNYGINSELDIICYNITLMGVTGPYDSPAVTATHIHQAVEGAAGPPRIALPNPEPADSGPEVVKRSSGCIQGPFTVGVKSPAGADTGEGFKLKQIEDNPAGFFTDSHTQKSVPGVVRAQLTAGGAAQGGVAPPAGVAPAVAPGAGLSTTQPANVQFAKGPVPNAQGGQQPCSVQVILVGPPVQVTCLN